MLQTSVMLLTFWLSPCRSRYAYFTAVSRGDRTAQNKLATSHLSVLLFILVANWGFGLLLNHYQLVYRPWGSSMARSYTASHLTLVALWGMLVLSVIACVLLAVNVSAPAAAVAGGVRPASRSSTRSLWF